ncbi:MULTISPECIES: phosphoglycerate mutase family protein [Acidithiobacillus]|uniref:2,3-bisphosphoglycerate-dependent phosphoglycerate mutase n=2 Tax=Acidithiobacillus ferridurans TaxID=1232575 RepID=A0A2Z6ILC1_ACIFI|nr:MULTISPECIES: phosphoglycerate mutase family protein [Acidithiobacillus]BBF66581.1 2,3-bisphosphoglycerate-dependent phosphoglycerate mutase [Acidithiobacillus ferridurans]
MNLESITLVRHGMTEWASSGRHTSVTDVELTAEGRKDAQALRTPLWRWVLSTGFIPARCCAPSAPPFLRVTPFLN